VKSNIVRRIADEKKQDSITVPIKKKILSYIKNDKLKMKYITINIIYSSPIFSPILQYRDHISTDTTRATITSIIPWILRNMAYVPGLNSEPKSLSAASKLFQGKFLKFEILTST